MASLRQYFAVRQQKAASNAKRITFVDSLYDETMCGKETGLVIGPTWHFHGS